VNVPLSRRPGAWPAESRNPRLPAAVTGENRLILPFTSGCATNTSTTDQMKPMKAGEHMLMLNQVETTRDLDALKNDDSVAMVCTKCKTVWVSRVKQGTKGAQILMANGQPTEMIGTHACQGCNSTLTVTGHTKGDTVELKHTCTACGDDSAFCWATKPGRETTKGMETK
jgi:ribosomal protein L44E